MNFLLILISFSSVVNHSISQGQKTGQQSHGSEFQPGHILPLPKYNSLSRGGILGSNTGNSSRANQRKDSVARVKLAVLTPCRARVSSALLIQSASPATKIRCSLSPTLRSRATMTGSTFPSAGPGMIQTLQSIFCIQPVHLPTDGIPHTGNRCYPEALFLYFQTCTTR